jgi:antitoxin ParD1/3/4
MYSIEPTINQPTDRQPHIDELHRLWQQATEDDSPGVPADEVLDRLERKYQANANRCEAG